jgi:hypothetical protein
MTGFIRILIPGVLAGDQDAWGRHAEWEGSEVYLVRAGNRPFRGKVGKETQGEEARANLGTHLHALEQLDLITADDAEGNFVFRDVRTRDTAYNGLLFVQRRQLHRQVAEWIEENLADDLTRHLGQLAFHWRFADEPAKAIGYLERAGRVAHERGEYAQAASFLEQSLELEEKLAVLSQRFYGEDNG